MAISVFLLACALLSHRRGIRIVRRLGVGVNELLKGFGRDPKMPAYAKAGNGAGLDETVDGHARDVEFFGNVGGGVHG
jgi:hypothetical protein